MLNYRGKSDDLCIHVVTDQVMGGTAQIVSELAGRFRANFKLHVIPAAWSGRLSSAPLTGYYQTSVYWNFFIAELLPEDIGKVLYLDADTIVVSDISELLALPLTDATIAAVSDLSASRMTKHWGIASYVNNGVMLINLDRWRSSRYSARCFEFCRDQSERLVFLDQCALNVVLSGDIRLLPERWNGFVHKQAPDASDSAILHYLTATKPWQSWYPHPLGSHYWRYLNVSPFAGAEPDKPRTVPERILLAKYYAKQGRYKEALDIYNSFRFETRN